MSLFSSHAFAVVTATILAGGETDLPADTPSGRLDTAGEFGFIGALAISSGGGNYKGSAVALSREWVLTAGHNTDLNDDGLPDASWSGTFYLSGYGSYGVAQAFTCTEFTGFANPSVNDDLALLHLAVPLPLGMGFPTLGSGAGIGDIITLVGFGRSGKPPAAGNSWESTPSPKVMAGDSAIRAAASWSHPTWTGFTKPPGSRNRSALWCSGFR